MSRALEKMQQRADDAQNDLASAIDYHLQGKATNGDLAEAMIFASTVRMSLKILECMEEAEKGKNIDKWWELL